MIKLKTILIFMTSLIVLSSCEDVIELDLKDTEPRIVIEANYNISSDSIEVVVSKSTGFYESGTQILVKPESVILIDQVGKNHDLILQPNGRFLGTGYQGNAGDKFSVIVSVENVDYSANAIVPQKAELISIDTTSISFGFGGNMREGFQMTANWESAPGLDNFYRIRTYNNHELEKGNYFLFKDFESETAIENQMLRQLFIADSLVGIELMSINRDYYTFFNELSIVQDGGLSSSVPFNPSGNFDNEALGYFGIFSTTQMEIQL